MSTITRSLFVLGLLGLSCMGFAQEAEIRKNLMERIPQIKSVEEVNKSPIAGVYEVRVNGMEIYYTDAAGNYLILGSIIDTQKRRDLTEERLDQITAIKFSDLPFKDAFTIVRGNGKRKVAVFEDPNCGYCKNFERELQKIDNVTVYMFLYPILGADSGNKSKAIWCSKDRGQVWQDWMVRNKALPTSTRACDTSALDRNTAFGHSYRITGTPTLIFTDNTRVPGAIDAKQLEKRLSKAAS